jgi:hypothetical protein
MQVLSSLFALFSWSYVLWGLTRDFVGVFGGLQRERATARAKTRQ